MLNVKMLRVLASSEWVSQKLAKFVVKLKLHKKNRNSSNLTLKSMLKSIKDIINVRMFANQLETKIDY
jgi:hypothetical protein